MWRYTFYVKSFRFVKLIFISHYRSRHRARAIPPHPCVFHELSFREQKFEEQHPPDHRYILAAVHRPAHAFFSRPSFVFFSSSYFLFCPGAFIVHRTACMHARDPQFLRSYNSICIVRQSSIAAYPDVGCLLI